MHVLLASNRVKEVNFGQAGNFGQHCFNFIHASELTRRYIYSPTIKRMPFFISYNEAHFPVYIQYFKTRVILGTCVHCLIGETNEKQIAPTFFIPVSKHVRLGKSVPEFFF